VRVQLGVELGILPSVPLTHAAAPTSPAPQRAWAESRPRCPLICLLSPGSDPTKLIEDLAKRKKIKTLGVSMGQGQEVGLKGGGVRVGKAGRQRYWEVGPS
jgi:hypothetical protein